MPTRRIEVWNPYDRRWVGGFEAVEAVRQQDQPHYRVRRTADGTILPGLLPPDRVRPEGATAPDVDLTQE